MTRYAPVRGHRDQLVSGLHLLGGVLALAALLGAAYLADLLAPLEGRRKGLEGEREVSAVYVLEMVGGPYDGADGMFWNEAAALGAGHDPTLPSEVLVATCRGKDCEGTHRTHPHPWYWLEMEDPPTGAVRYGLLEVEDPEEEGRRGRARYGFAGVGLLDRETAGAEALARR